LSIFNNVDNFIFPIFVYENELIYRNSLSLQYLNDSKVFVGHISAFIEKLIDLKICNILIFGIPKKRNSFGTSSFDKNGITQNSIKTIRENFGSKVNIISDVCICQYNTSGHCGMYYNNRINKSSYPKKMRNLKIDNDKTLNILGKISLSLSESGTDFIAPSSMMDGQVFYLRKILENNSFGNIKIMSYSSKHNSCLYAPFRSNNYFNSGFIDKSSYQNSVSNQRESVREVLMDIDEGADWIMIKPSFWYMDLVKAIKSYTEKPLVVQNVSGEYAFIEAAAEKKWLNKTEWCILSLLSLRRAGADKIISYFIFELLNKICDT
jgi:porphobilinogen synthase